MHHIRMRILQGELLSQPSGHLFSYAGGKQRKSHSFVDEV